jgi:two-component system NtrC family sensor kinase
MLRPAATVVVSAYGNTVGVPSVNKLDDGASASPSRDDLVRAGKVAALGELTPGIAHELNNPLFAVIGLVDFLLRDAEPGSRSHRRLTVVRDTALEMRTVLRTLVDFARESTDTHAVIDVGDTVRQTAELVRRTSSAKDVELIEELPSESLSVLGNRNQLRQVLLHLLTNACASLPRGGTVTIGLARRNARASVTVADSGAGVPPELRMRIFEPFFTTRPGASGLGLAAGRAIAESHGGSLELRSGGEGATFVLTLPVTDEEVGG